MELAANLIWLMWQLCDHGKFGRNRCGKLEASREACCFFLQPSCLKHPFRSLRHPKHPSPLLPEMSCVWRHAAPRQSSRSEQSGDWNLSGQTRPLDLWERFESLVECERMCREMIGEMSCQMVKVKVFGFPDASGERLRLSNCAKRKSVVFKAATASLIPWHKDSNAS